MNHKHGPKFFCEFYDTEVPLNARLCPKCGRFFASVRCPGCGYAGEHSAFKKGCPKCGYAMRTAEEDGPGRQPVKKNKKSDDPLPIWIYVSIVVLLTIVLKVLYDFLR